MMEDCCYNRDVTVTSPTRNTSLCSAAGDLFRILAYIDMILTPAFCEKSAHMCNEGRRRCHVAAAESAFDRHILELHRLDRDREHPRLRTQA